MISYFKGVKTELGKVSWLKPKEVFQRFWSVTVISAIILLYFGLIDLVVTGVKNLF